MFVRAGHPAYHLLGELHLLLSEAAPGHGVGDGQRRDRRPSERQRQNHHPLDEVVTRSRRGLRRPLVRERTLRPDRAANQIRFHLGPRPLQRLLDDRPLLGIAVSQAYRFDSARAPQVKHGSLA